MPQQRRPIDVVYAIEHEGRACLLIYTSEWGMDWLSASGTYRLKIILYGEPSKQAEIFLHVEWNGIPGDLKVMQGPATL